MLILTGRVSNAPSQRSKDFGEPFLAQSEPRLLSSTDCFQHPSDLSSLPEVEMARDPVQGQREGRDNLNRVSSENEEASQKTTTRNSVAGGHFPARTKSSCETVAFKSSSNQLGRSLTSTSDMSRRLTSTSNTKWQPPVEKGTSGYPLSQLQMLSTWNFWYFFVLFLILQSPGFGVKILVTSIMETLYQTGPTESALVSGVFFTSYSVMRFFAGFIPAFLPVKKAFVYGGIIQGVTFLAVPLIVDNTTNYYTFVFFITISGCVLAALTTLGPLLLKEIWGETNLNKAVGSTIFTAGVAVWIGPITSYVLVKDEGDELGQSASIFFLGFGSLSVMAGIGVLFVKPYAYDDAKSVLTSQSKEAFSQTQSLTQTDTGSA